MRDHHALRAPGRAPGIGEPADHFGLGFVNQRRRARRKAFRRGGRVRPPSARTKGDVSRGGRAPWIERPRGELRPFDDQRGDLGVLDDEGLVVFRRERMQRRVAAAP